MVSMLYAGYELIFHLHVQIRVYHIIISIHTAQVCRTLLKTKNSYRGIVYHDIEQC